jgi:hypothetical protein
MGILHFWKLEPNRKEVNEVAAFFVHWTARSGKVGGYGLRVLLAFGLGLGSERRRDRAWRLGEPKRQPECKTPRDPGSIRVGPCLVSRLRASRVPGIDFVHVIRDLLRVNKGSRDVVFSSLSASPSHRISSALLLLLCCLYVVWDGPAYVSGFADAGHVRDRPAEVILGHLGILPRQSEGVVGDDSFGEHVCLWSESGVSSCTTQLHATDEAGNQSIC